MMAIAQKRTCNFKSLDAKFKEFPGAKYTVQVAQKTAPAWCMRGILPGKG
jgi:hypothetical protein